MLRLIGLVLVFAIHSAANAVELIKWSYVPPAISADIVPITAIADDNGVWVGGTVGYTPVVARYSNAGALEAFSFVSPLSLFSAYTSSMTLVPLQASGVLVILRGFSDFGGPDCGVVRFESDGTEMWAGSRYSVNCNIVSVDPTGAIVLITNFMETFRLAADGAENDQRFAVPPYIPAETLGSFPPAQGVAYAEETLAQVISDNDGFSYLVTTDSTSSDGTLSRISPQGILQWRALDVDQAPILGVSGDRVCLSGSTLTCYAKTDGHLLLSVDLTSQQVLAEQLLDSNEVLVVSLTQPDRILQATLYGDDGEAESNLLALAYRISLNPPQITVSTAGIVFVIDNNSTSAVAAFERYGHPVYSADVSALAGLPEGVASVAGKPAPDGTLFLTMYDGTDGSGNQTLILSPNGQRVGSVPDLGAVTIVDGIGYLLSVTQPDGMSRVRRISLSDATILSDVTLQLSDYNVSVDPSTGLVVSNADHVRIYNPITGALLHDVPDRCVSVPCADVSTPAVLLNRDGTVVIARTVDRREKGIAVRVDEYAETAAPPSIRIDQPGLDGVWYVQTSSGQGFTIDYFPGVNVFFMAWFTFAYQGNALYDPAELSWVTLQGTVMPGATGADLALVRSLPGIFDHGKVGSRIAGTAHLTFSDCNNGLLDVHFDPTDFFGAEYSAIPITRLSPTTSPCILADSSVMPPQNANAPHHGFDARQSGSWFDPSTSGQGLELTIIPDGNGFAGLVYGAWFTFDPPPANDDQQEHWFTLQGDLSGATDGSIQLPILQTFGSTLLGPSTADTHRVGIATLTFTACDSATLSYAFDDSDVAHAFAGISGTIHLTKINGCSAN